MKKIVTLCSLFLSGIGFASAQSVSLHTDTVQLNVVFEDVKDSAVFYIINQNSFDIFVESQLEFPFYTDTVARIRLSSKTILANDSISGYISAKVVHNVLHRGSIIINFKNSPNGALAVPYKFQGRYTKTYYATTENLTETNLRTALKTKISTGTVSLSYEGARDQMYGSLDNVNGNVTCIYTGRVATFSTRSGATSNNFNCEHTWPQSLFNQNLPMRSDIHHLFSTDETANSQRGNMPFGLVANPSWQVGGSKKNASTFEPRDLQKGATARAMMYFVLRYQDYNNFFAPQQAILRSWHNQFAPSAIEIQRNNGIFAIQNNRNPFVDYPQFAQRITSLVGTSAAAPVYGLASSTDTATLAFGQNLTGTDNFWVYLYNYGNTPISISNLNLSNAGLNFALNSGANATLLPNQALPIIIDYQYFINYTTATLTYNTNVPSKPTGTVYINSISGIGTQEWTGEKPEIRISQTEVSWHNATGTWQIFAADGTIVFNGTANQSGHVSLLNLPNGLYVFTLQTAQGSFAEKLILYNR